MKYLIIAMLTLAMLSSSAQTKFLGSTGGYLVNDDKATYTNNVITDQLVFADTIKAARMVVNKEYLFNAKFYITVPALSLPAISFKLMIAGQPMSFVSNAGLLTGATNSPLEIRGIIVKRTSGLTYLEFTLLQNGTAGIALTPSTVSETSELTIDNSVDVPLALYVTFSNNSNTTTLIRQRVKRSDF